MQHDPANLVLLCNKPPIFNKCWKVAYFFSCRHFVTNRIETIFCEIVTFVWIQIEVKILSITSETADESEKIESQDDDKGIGIASSEKTREKIKFITDF